MKNVKKARNTRTDSQLRSSLGTFVPAEGERGKPVCVALPIEADEVVRALPNRSEKLRQWIVEGMRREGLL